MKTAPTYRRLNLHRISQNDEHCKNQNEYQICTVYRKKKKEHGKNENKCQICTVYQKMMNMAKPINECQICTVYQNMMNMAKLETSRTFSQLLRPPSKCWRFLNQIHGVGSAMRRPHAIHKLFTEQSNRSLPPSESESCPQRHCQ